MNLNITLTATISKAMLQVFSFEFFQGRLTIAAQCPLLFNFSSGFIARNGERRGFIIQEVTFALKTTKSSGRTI
jgi:hypothetical protein